MTNLKDKTQNQKQPPILGIRLVSGIDLVGIRGVCDEFKICLEKTIQISAIKNNNSLEIIFMPLNIFDRNSQIAPYRDVIIYRNNIIYEYLPDAGILDSYLNILNPSTDKSINSIPTKLFAH